MPPPPRRLSLYEFSGDQTFGRRHRLQTVDATGDDELTPGTLPPCPPARRAPSEVVRFGGNGNVCKPAAASLARTNIFPENPSPLPSLPLLPPTPLLFDYLPTHLVCPSARGPPQPPSVAPSWSPPWSYSPPARPPPGLACNGPAVRPSVRRTTSD